MFHENVEKYEKHVEQARQYAAAQRLKEDILHLKARWLRYSFPVQGLLQLLLTTYGLGAAQLATDALDRETGNGLQHEGGER